MLFVPPKLLLLCSVSCFVLIFYRKKNCLLGYRVRPKPKNEKHTGRKIKFTYPLIHSCPPVLPTSNLFIFILFMSTPLYTDSNSNFFILLW